MLIPPDYQIPLPISHYIRSKIASRTQFWRYEKMGLRILHVGGKRFLRPNDFNRFVQSQHAKQEAGEESV